MISCYWIYNKSKQIKKKDNKKYIVFLNKCSKLLAYNMQYLHIINKRFDKIYKNI